MLTEIYRQKVQIMPNLKYLDVYLYVNMVDIISLLGHVIALCTGTLHP